MPKQNKIKVYYRKLGKERAWGWAHENYIEIDERLRGKKKVEILLHECFHYLFPDLDEKDVVKKSVTLTNTLWNEHIRPVDNDDTQPLQDC